MASSASSDRSNPVALVTGASSGIGEALAPCFAAAGHDLVLVARSADKLQVLARQLADEHGIKAWVEPADLAQPGAAARLVATLRRKRRRIDVLVNNAGVLVQGPFVGMKRGEAGRMIDLNISGLTALLDELLPAMVARGSGRVLNVASIAAFQPVPTLATYAATKAYVLSLTEALAEELRGSGVSVGALCPGVTATAMLDRAAARNGRLGQLPGLVVGRVEDVAAAAYRACFDDEVVTVPGGLKQAAALASRAAPKWLLRRLTGVLGRRVL